MHFQVLHDRDDTEPMRSPLWLIGVDAPIIQNHSSKCLKILKKISGCTYIRARCFTEKYYFLWPV
jgi:hypothetical protein